jgi:mRNA-degrading endonuclease YafQ of YafQ-DinJ toxin-antitoxin module
LICLSMLFDYIAYRKCHISADSLIAYHVYH